MKKKILALVFLIIIVLECFVIYNKEKKVTTKDEIEEKENGSYIFMSKKEDDVFFEFKIDVMDENFNLSYIDINTPEKKYHVDFDA